MNPIYILRIVIIILELIARGMDSESAINKIANEHNISASFLREFL
ncbi:hypothetical protein [Clostridium sp. C8-1-8]|nr:hypothetical protein [Clostridium sp. C8-1-8]